ncbi:formate dehydrogenase accessory protein FdhE [Allorhizocola rhizosphaerae]|uniref:formate dehydrogenase accessory protein FdhE domain-containing protein n=1 Tax=Allorhizocola rhizosphaerae TaxID=1872709 RepID=UPI000E3E71A2|nr:formate dehydrogenase accessory protein FdhE [Allorhizocola rhizosphaerae]
MKRRRALQLRERYPFAAPVMTFYVALLDSPGDVVAAVDEAGPAYLREAVRRPDPPEPVARFLERATWPGGEHECVPLLSFRAAPDEPLVAGRRRLMCAWCKRTWAFSASACPVCGEKTTSYADRDVFAHMTIEACRPCSRYLIEVDLGRDRQAVPEVDELAALPLDLYAAEQGLTKITPNLMGV